MPLLEKNNDTLQQEWLSQARALSPRISRTPPVHLPYTSLTPPVHLPYTSLTPPVHLPGSRSSPARARPSASLYLPHISRASPLQLAGEGSTIGLLKELFAEEYEAAQKARKAATFSSVGKRFVNDLNSLLSELQSARSSFIRCVKPNAEGKARAFTSSYG